MKKIKNFFINYYPALTYLFLSLFVFGWFKGHSFIGAGDFGWPIKFDTFFNVTKNVWDSSIAPGYNASRQVSSIFPYALYGYLFFKMHLSSAIFERFVFFTSFFFSGYGFYLLALRFVKNKFNAFLSGLVYMLSPYASVVIWNPSYGMVFPFYSYLPLSLSFLIDYYRSDTLLNDKLVKALLVTFLSFMGASFSNPAFFLMYIFIGSVFAFGSQKDLITLLKKVSIYFILFSTLNSFWIVPFITSIGDQYKNANNEHSGLISDSATRLLNSVSLKGALSESGFWAFNASEGSDFYYSFTWLFDSHVFKFLSYVLVAIVLIGYKVVDKRNRFLYVLYLLGLYLCSGLLFPSILNFPARAFYNLPLIDRLYRSVFLKTGILITLPFSILIGIVLDRMTMVSDLSRSFFKKSVYAVLMATLILRAYPFITGQVIKNPGKLLPAFAFSVPDDYYEVADYINNNIGKSYLLTLPLPKSYNFVYRWKHSGYAGGDFFRTLISKSNYYINIDNPLVEGFAQSYDTSLLDRLGVKYILVHKDVPIDFSNRFLTNNFYELNKFLLNDKSLKKIKETENLVLYELSSGNPVPLVYVATSSVLVPEYDRYSSVFNKLNTDEVTVETTASSKHILLTDLIDNKYRDFEVWNQGWQWPETNVDPASWKYSLIQLKEWFILLRSKDAQEKINKYVWLSAKRAAELEKFDMPQKQIQKINRELSSNSAALEKMLEEIKNSDSSDSKKEYSDILNKVLRYTHRSLATIPENKTESKNILNNFYQILLDESKIFCAQRCTSFKSTFTGIAHVDGIENLDVFQVDGVVSKSIKKITPTSFNVLADTYYFFNQAERVLPLTDAPVSEVNSPIYTTRSINMIEQVQNADSPIEFATRNPVVLKKELKNIDPSKRLTLYMEYEKTNASIGMVVTQRTKEVAEDIKVLKIGDIEKSPLHDMSGVVFAKEFVNINSMDTPYGTSSVYSKDIDVSKNTTSIEIQVFVYSPSGSTDVTKITNIHVVESEKKLPIVTNFVKANDLNKNLVVNYTKNTPTDYSLLISGTKGTLVFNTGFDAGWIAVMPDGSELKHFRVDGYKNAWLLPTSDKPYTLKLIYLPEKHKILGFYVAGSMFSLLLALYLRTIVIKLIRNYTNK